MTKAGPAKQDIYGQLYYYLKRLFMDFHQHLRSKPVSFELHHVDARNLGKKLRGREFDRIDVSNICDKAYLGIYTTLATFSPLLPNPSTKAHATLITAFLSAVADSRMEFPIRNSVALDTQAAARYIGLDRSLPNRTFAQMEEGVQIDIIRITLALDSVGDMDRYFDMYV